MQVITMQQLIEALHVAHEAVQVVFGLIFRVLWHNATTIFPTAISDSVSGNWVGVAVCAAVVLGSTILLYRLVRSRPLMMLKSIFYR